MILNEPYNKDTFNQFLKGFLPDYQKDEREVRTPDSSILTHVTQLGASRSRELDITVLEAECEETDTNKRIAITQAAFKVLRDHQIRNAIVAFHDGNDQWRLSLLTSTLEIKDGKVVKKDSNPRRYSYLLGVGAKTVTPYKYLVEKGRVEDIKSLQERFSVEVVNKQFYASVADLFTKLVGGERGVTKHPGLLKINSVISQDVEHQEFAVRLIGRIIFSWFLKEKKSETGVPIVPNDLLSLDAVSSNADYYHSILEPLFFELLNKRVENRHESLREAPFSTVPYLNGGLFSPQRGDFYNQNSFNGAGTPDLTHIPDEWFKELFEILNQYNFTVDENTSYDVDLSIDPEMLGRIFENLLAEINPETGESARKSTGSFYTPREIVDYMVDSSLLEFLKSKTGADEAKLKALISWGKSDDEEHPLSADEKAKVVTALAGLTILDPACGSGAFPIGILQKVVYILQQADPKAKIWLENQLKNISSPDLKRDIQAKYESENYDWLRKYSVIRESIFGVDIQSIATEIAKLRCFLTLVIEEDVDDNNNGNHNRGVHPLPNLDFKFITANSLVPAPQSKIDDNLTLFNDDYRHKLSSLVNLYFSSTGEERYRLIDQIKELINKKANESKDFVLHDYGIINDDRFQNIYRQGKSERNNTLLREASMWESYKNIFSHEPVEFFDKDLMFPSVSEGFDIVIANPPYIHLESIKDLAQKLYKPLGFKTYEARGDIYSLFYEKGVQNLRDGGILTFITSNKWMRAGYGASLRDFFVEQANPISLIDLGGGVFESATVDTSILVLRKETYAGNTHAVATSKDFSVNNMSDYIEQNTIEITFEKGDPWAILSPIEQSIKAKIETVGTPLRDWDIQINYGVKTGLNEAFIIDRAKRDELIKKDPKSAEIIRPILRGKDIKRNSYTFADKYLICTFPAKHYDINDYPVIRDYLLSFDERVLAQTGEKNIDGIKGKNARKKTNNKWFETQDSISYWDDFNQQKIMFSRISGNEPCFALDNDGYMTNDTGYILTGEGLEYLLEQLTSPAIWFAFRHFYMGGGIEKEFKVNNLQNLPVPKPGQELVFTDDEMKLISSSVNP